MRLPCRVKSERFAVTCVNDVEEYYTALINQEAKVGSPAARIVAEALSLYFPEPDCIDIGAIAMPRLSLHRLLWSAGTVPAVGAIRWARPSFVLSPPMPSKRAPNVHNVIAASNMSDWKVQEITALAQSNVVEPTGRTLQDRQHGAWLVKPSETGMPDQAMPPVRTIRIPIVDLANEVVPQVDPTSGLAGEEAVLYSDEIEAWVNEGGAGDDLAT